MARTNLGRWHHDLQAGLVIALFTVVLSLSFGSLLFSGDLATASAQGVRIALITAVVAGAAIAWRSSYPATVAIPQDRTAPILALMAAEITASLPAGTPLGVRSAVVLAAIALTTLITGGVLYWVGRRRLGNLFRFIPYPVIGGFLAGSGWLLAIGAFRVMLDAPVRLKSLPLLFDFDMLLKWGPGIAFGMALFVAMRTFRRPLIVPGMLVGGVVMFYLVLLASGMSVVSARDAGLLPALPEARGYQVQFWSVPDLTMLGGAVLLKIAGIAGTVLLTALISILLNASALELVVHEEIDINRELEAAGLANLISGMAGGMLGFQSLSLSRLAYDLGARTRVATLFASALCVVALIAGPAPLAFLPKLIPGGLLLYIGLGFLVEWGYDAWSRLPRSDYVVVLLILFVVGGVGYLQGVLVGILAAVFLFIHNYSRVGVVTRAHTGTDYQSNVERPIPHQRLLRARGGETQVLRLHGFIFFGTSARVLDQIRNRALDQKLSGLRFFVLDFRHVSGIDSSATLSLARARQLAEKQGFVLCLSQVPADIRHQLLRAGLANDAGNAYRFFPDLDHAIEWCEEQILAIQRDETAEGKGLRSQLEAIWSKPEYVSRLMPYLERQTFDIGSYLIRQGDVAESLYFLESGQVTTRLELDDGRTRRLRRQGGGTVLGELGLFLGVPRTASVVAEEPCVAYRLSADGLDRMKRCEPEVAGEFYEFLVRCMSERIVNCNKTIRALAE